MKDPQKKDLIFKTTDQNPFWGEDFSPYNSKIWIEKPKHFYGATVQYKILTWILYSFTVLLLPKKGL